MRRPPSISTRCLSKLRDHDAVDVLALAAATAALAGRRQFRYRACRIQASVNDCPVLIIDARTEPSSRISNSFRRRLKSKENKLKALPGYRYHVTSRRRPRSRGCSTGFFRVKPERMARAEIAQRVRRSGIEDFIRSAAERGRGRRAARHRHHALECDEEIIAFFAGVADGHRFSIDVHTLDRLRAHGEPSSSALDT